MKSITEINVPGFKPTVKTITAGANDALSLFRQAIVKLETSNEQAEVLKLNNQTKIDALTADNTALTNLSQDNSAVITNIQGLLGDRG